MNQVAQGSPVNRRKTRTAQNTDAKFTVTELERALIEFPLAIADSFRNHLFAKFAATLVSCRVSDADLYAVDRVAISDNGFEGKRWVRSFLRVDRRYIA
jgi:hypothetical protein